MKNNLLLGKHEGCLFIRGLRCCGGSYTILLLGLFFYISMRSDDGKLSQISTFSSEVDFSGVELFELILHYKLALDLE